MLGNNMDFEFVAVKTEQDYDDPVEKSVARDPLSIDTLEKEEDEVRVKIEIVEEEAQEAEDGAEEKDGGDGDSAGVAEDAVKGPEGARAPSPSPGTREIEEILIKVEPDEEMDEDEAEYEEESSSSSSSEAGTTGDQGGKTKSGRIGAATKQQQCDRCERTFATKHSLAAHMWRFHEVRLTHLCPDCPDGGGEFSERDVLFKHLEEVHGKRFVCDDCGKAYGHIWDLHAHVIEAHLGARRHVCDICNKSYNRRSNLNRHTAAAHEGVKLQRSGGYAAPYHTREKFPCHICHRYYRYGSALARHMVSHDRVRKRKKTYSREIHSCPVCNKAFFQKCYLRVHMAGVHEGLQFKCPLCEAGFAEMRPLTDHMYTVHHGLRKVFTCEACDRGFSCRASLVAHKEEAHPATATPTTAPAVVCCKTEDGSAVGQ